MTLVSKLVGDYAPDFELPGIDGKVYHLGRYQENFKAIAVVFIGDRSPQVTNYLNRLKEIQSQFAEQKFTIVAINSHNSENSLAQSVTEMKAFAAANELNFPYLRDFTQEVAKAFGAKVMPEVFLLDSQAVILYAGQIDDNADSAEKVQNHYLKDSIANLLSGQKVAIAQTQPVGTPIAWHKK